MQYLVVVLAFFAVLMTGCQRGDPSGQSAAFVHPHERRAWWSRPLAIANADAQVHKLRLSWGPVNRVYDPAPWREGMWWQVDYHPPSGEKGPCVIIVDANSGWARLPPADYAIRVQVNPGSPAASPTDSKAIAEAPTRRAPRGSWVLEVQSDAQTDLAVLADELNALAAQRDLPALAVVRQRPQPRVVYGWQGDYAMERDEGLQHWLRLERPSWTTRWLDLYRAAAVNIY